MATKTCSGARAARQPFASTRRRPTFLSSFMAIFMAIAAASPTQALEVLLPSLEKVMAGASSGGNDQIWARVEGQPAGVHADCVYQAWSLFFVPDDAVVSRDRALSLLMTAKVSGQPVRVQYDVLANASDFWGFGISKCAIRRIAVGG